MYVCITIIITCLRSIKLTVRQTEITLKVNSNNGLWGGKQLCTFQITHINDEKIYKLFDNLQIYFCYEFNWKVDMFGFIQWIILFDFYIKNVGLNSIKNTYKILKI